MSLTRFLLALSLDIASHAKKIDDEGDGRAGSAW